MERVNERGKFVVWPRSLAALLLLMAAICFAGACGSPEDATYEAEYLLVDHLNTMTSDAKRRRVPKSPRHAIGHDERRVILQHPPLTYRFPDVPSGPQARLAVAPIILPGAWDKPGDGAVFEATCRAPDGNPVQLLELSISPATNPEDRIWHDREVALDRCSQPTTQIELRTSCGPRDDCTADWAAWGHARVVHSQVPEPRFDRLVLLISIDTLRPDRLGLYGGPRETSPELERFARDAIVFETAVATSPWTIPSHASMLTSTDPCIHGADTRTAIADSVPLLAEVLKGRGWQTAGFVDSFYMNRKFGFQRGFDHYDDRGAPKGDYRRGARLVRQRLVDWLADADEQPAFIFWHIMDVHGPYRASAPFGGRFRGAVPPAEAPDPRIEQMRDLAYHDYLGLDQYSSFDDLLAAYDEGVAEVDSILGGFFQMLRDAGLYDDALIVVTSDHGESFLDHGIWVGHGLFLTDDEIRIPLIIKLPDNRRAGTRIRGLASLVDVAPSILDALDIEAPSSFQGRSLISASPGQPGTATGFSENTGARFVRTEDFKYISPATVVAKKVLEGVLKSRGERGLPVVPRLREQLYDLRQDAQETATLTRSPAGKQPPDGADELKRFRAEFARVTMECGAWKARVQGAGVPEPTPEARRQLEALGYVD